MTVGQLVKELQANQANVSKHLKVLTDAGILSPTRSGHGRLLFDLRPW